MSIHLIIDGYNLIRKSPSLSRVELEEFRRGREKLLEDLVRYKALRGHRITVVFDGWKGGEISEVSESVKGIRVIFSRLGEKADHVIKRIVEKEGEKAVIVTSDSDIAHFASKKKAAVISASGFEQKMIDVLFDKQSEESDDWEKPKKGSAKKPPRHDRRCKMKLKKL